MAIPMRAMTTIDRPIFHYLVRGSVARTVAMLVKSGLFAFHEGCIVYTRDPSRGAEDDDEGHAVGEPIDKPDADNDDR